MSTISQELSQAREDWKKENPGKNPLTDPNYPLQFVTEKPRVIDKGNEDFVRLIFRSITKGKIITTGEFQDWFYGKMLEELNTGFGGAVVVVKMYIESKWGNDQSFFVWVLTRFTH